MYKIKVNEKDTKGNNVALDFNEGSEEIWERTRADRAGEVGLSMKELELLSSNDEIIVGYRLEGRVKKTRIGTGSIRDLILQILRKATEWGTSIHVWGANGRDITDLGSMEKEVEQ